MILTVSGWRKWQDRQFAINQLRGYIYNYGDALHVRVGCADGLDEIMRTYLAEGAAGFHVSYTVYRAEWARLGRKAAGPVRNLQMLSGGNPEDRFPGIRADRLMAFPEPGVKWRSPGSGTVGCMLEAFLLGIDVEVPGYSK